MKENLQYISQVKVTKLWGRLDFDWSNINEDVNIIVGINGSGKTTLLNLISDYYQPSKSKKLPAEAIKCTDISIPVTYIRSFDIPANSKKKTESMLLQELKHVINQNGEGTSFFDYRMKMLNFPDMAEEIQRRISVFFDLVNSMFSETGKKIIINPKNNTLAFSIEESDDILQIDQLSSGEKQLLLILTTVFLQEEKPNVLLMDEPEISLHISWQDSLISLIRSLNKNCQIILTTHSPNIFANGWEDKIVFIQDLLVKYLNKID